MTENFILCCLWCQLDRNGSSKLCLCFYETSSCGCIKNIQPLVIPRTQIFKEACRVAYIHLLYHKNVFVSVEDSHFKTKITYEGSEMILSHFYSRNYRDCVLNCMRQHSYKSSQAHKCQTSVKPVSQHENIGPHTIFDSSPTYRIVRQCEKPNIPLNVNWWAKTAVHKCWSILSTSFLCKTDSDQEQVDAIKQLLGNEKNVIPH